MENCKVRPVKLTSANMAKFQEDYLPKYKDVDLYKGYIGEFSDESLTISESSEEDIVLSVTKFIPYDFQSILSSSCNFV